MYHHALDKVRDEMAAKANNPGVQTMGEGLTEMLQQRPEIAAQILTKDKTVEGAFDEVRKYAQSHKTGNFAFVPPQKAMEIVAGYFGFDAEKAEPQAPAEKPAPVKRAEPDDLDLDALLGGL